jgi:hypothetical protein
MAKQAIGWRGYARVGPPANRYVLPYISSTISETQGLIRSETIHGGGVGTTNGVFHSEHNYSLGQVLVQGDIETEVFGGHGNYALAFYEMLYRAIGKTTDDTSARTDGFNAANPFILSPGGGFAYVMPYSGLTFAKAVVSNMRLRGNPGGNVQCSFTVVSAGTDRLPPADHTTDTSLAPLIADLAFEPTCSAGNANKGPVDQEYNPVPYYASAFTISDCTGETSLADRITDWEIEVNNNSNPIYTFNGQPWPVDILQGIMEVTGRFSYYSPEGGFERWLTHGATMNLTIGLGVHLRSLHLGFDAAPIPTPGMNQPVVRNVTFRSFAQATGDSLFIV